MNLNYHKILENSHQEKIKFSLTDMDFNKILDPKSIAILGCSGNLSRLSNRPLKFLIKNQYKGNIYPVNPKYKEICGYPSYPSIESIPDSVDTAVILLPADKVEYNVKKCAENGVGSLIIMSSGFAELGEEGFKIQERIKTISKQFKMPVLGPNCLGIINIAKNIPISFASILDEDTIYSGGLSLVSQSGAIGNFILGVAQQQKIGFSYWVTTGNEAVIEASQVANYLLKKQDVKGVLLYIEEARDPIGLITAGFTAKKLGKPLICLKVGRSESGKKAALSHTGAMTGSNEEYDAAFKKSGIVKADNIEELLDLGLVLTTSRRPEGNRVAIVSISGGGGILLADRCEELGLKVPGLCQESQKGLNEIIPRFGSAKNPIDLTAELIASPGMLKKSLEVVLDDENTDSILILFGMNKNNAKNLALDLKEVVSKARLEQKKPVLVTWMVAPDSAVDILRKSNIPLLFDGVRLTNCLKKLIDFSKTLQQTDENDDQNVSEERILTPESLYSIVESITNKYSSSKNFTVTEFQCKQIFKKIGISVPDFGLVRNEKDALLLAGKIGFPVVAKIISPDISHKSDANAVITGIKNEEEMKKAFNQIMSNSKIYNPKAYIDGVLIEEHINDDFLELIVGLKWSENFGSVILIGAGGIFVELLKDRQMCLSPVNRKDALDMIFGLKTAKLFQGFRSFSKRDIDATINTIVKLSNFGALLGSYLQELDINPLFVFAEGKGVKVGDGLMVLKR